MAQYRFSAKIISRSTGRSSVAAAAYRAGQDLTDERTGLAHEFGRRGGVLSADILAPDHAPEWAYDRARLWNAVERTENRVNSQLAREIQLSLPHELDDAGRRELLHTFVREQFVTRGMVADVAIHRPDRDGDHRNHHAHVMLTMREMTPDGFAKSKGSARTWNDTETLEGWREQWANHQNRALERGRHADRVDHRSFEARSIDREPTQHMGPTAHSMEKQGRPSRIGDENREVEDRNDACAEAHRRAVVLDLATERARRKPQEPEPDREGSSLSAAWDSRRHDDERATLETQLAETYGARVATLTEARDQLATRLEASGFRKILRDITGRSRADQIRLRKIERALASIERTQARERTALEQRHTADSTARERQQQGSELSVQWTTAATPATPAQAEPLRDYWAAAAGRTDSGTVEWSIEGGQARPDRGDGREGPER